MAKITITVEQEIDDDNIAAFFGELAAIDTKPKPAPVQPKSIDIFPQTNNPSERRSGVPHTITGTGRRLSNDRILYQHNPGYWSVNCHADGRADREQRDKIREFLDDTYPVDVLIDMEKPNKPDQFGNIAWRWTKMTKQ